MNEEKENMMTALMACGYSIRFKENELVNQPKHIQASLWYKQYGPGSGDQEAPARFEYADTPLEGLRALYRWKFGSPKPSELLLEFDEWARGQIGKCNGKEIYFYSHGDRLFAKGGKRVIEDLRRFIQQKQKELGL